MHDRFYFGKNLCTFCVLRYLSPWLYDISCALRHNRTNTDHWYLEIILPRFQGMFFHIHKRIPNFLLDNVLLPHPTENDSFASINSNELCAYMNYVPKYLTTTTTIPRIV